MGRNNSKKWIIFGTSILVVAVLIFLIIFILNKPWSIKEPKDWISQVKWFGTESYRVYEEGGKSIIYHPASGFKFFIPTDWNWDVGLANYWAYTASPNTTFQDETSITTGCYILISAFVGEDFYSRITEHINQIKESPESAFEVIKVAGAEGLYSKYPEGFNFSIINTPFNQQAILRIKVFYPPEGEDRETCNNAFLKIINEAERV